MQCEKLLIRIGFRLEPLWIPDPCRPAAGFIEGARTGPDFIVGIRMVADEDWDKGLSREEGVEIARRLSASGKIDFLNLIRGHIDSDAALTTVIPIQGMTSAPHLDFAGEVRAATKFPVFHAARIPDIATARHAVAEGMLDMVAMTRAHMADPHIVRKLVAGQADRIRPCVGAAYCIDRVYAGREAFCLHNPATGREQILPQSVERSAGPQRKVVVVGGGPAGLEAARVAAARGHRVVLFEASGALGGQVRLAARAMSRRDMIGIADWLAAEVAGELRKAARQSLRGTGLRAHKPTEHRNGFFDVKSTFPRRDLRFWRINPLRDPDFLAGLGHRDGRIDRREGVCPRAAVVVAIGVRLNVNGLRLGEICRKKQQTKGHV